MEKLKHRGNEHHLQERKGGRVALTEHLLYATCHLSTIFGTILATWHMGTLRDWPRAPGCPGELSLSDSRSQALPARLPKDRGGRR